MAKLSKKEKRNFVGIIMLLVICFTGLGVWMTFIIIGWHNDYTEKTIALYLQQLKNQMNEKYDDNFDLECISIKFANGTAELSKYTSGPPYTKMNSMVVYDKTNGVEFTAYTNLSDNRNKGLWDENYVRAFKSTKILKICLNSIAIPDNVQIEKITSGVLFFEQNDTKNEYQAWKNASEDDIISLLKESKPRSPYVMIEIKLNGNTTSAIDTAYQVYKFHADLGCNIDFEKLYINDDIKCIGTLNTIDEGVLPKKDFCEKMGLSKYL